MIDMNVFSWQYRYDCFNHICGFYMNHVIHTKMSEGRRVVIPAEMCHEYKLEPGQTVVLEPSRSGIVLRPLDTVLGEVQNFFADVAPPDVLLSEELSKDRQREAARENRD